MAAPDDSRVAQFPAAPGQRERPGKSRRTHGVTNFNDGVRWLRARCLRAVVARVSRDTNLRLMGKLPITPTARPLAARAHRETRASSHVRAVMAGEGDRAISGHLHKAQIGTWFARAYLLSS